MPLFQTDSFYFLPTHRKALSSHVFLDGNTVAPPPPTVSQIRGSGPTNKDETLMMMGILMLMLMLKVMRG